MAVRYTLRRAKGLDRDALLRALHLLPLDTWAGRWQAAKVTMASAQTASGDSQGWLWAYGVWLALAGRELPHSLGSGDIVSAGYRAGAELVEVGPLVLEHPLGQRRAIGSMSPGRCWAN